MRHHRQGGGDGADPQMAGDALGQGQQLVAQVVALADDAAGVFEDLHPLRREALELLAALDDGDLKLLLQLADGVGEGRLRNVAAFRRAAEMLLAGQRQQIDELAEHDQTAGSKGGTGRPGTSTVMANRPPDCGRRSSSSAGRPALALVT